MRGIAFFYVKEELGLRLGYWLGFAAVAGAFGGLIAFGVQHAHTAVSNWRLLFIVEVSHELHVISSQLMEGSNDRESPL